MERDQLRLRHHEQNHRLAHFPSGSWMLRSSPPAPTDLVIRPLQASDDFILLTDLLHRAYADLAHRGMKFLASHQDVAKTRDRCVGSGKDCFIAQLGPRIVGTITIRGPEESSECPHYLRTNICIAGQLGVEPDVQSFGIARALMDAAESRARQRKAIELLGDTSEHAAHLIAWYTRRGFRIIDTVQWSVTNYRSVVFSKSLH